MVTYSILKNGKLVVSGLTSSQIVDIFDISIKTFSNYVGTTQAFKKVWTFERDPVDYKKNEIWDDWDYVTKKIIRKFSKSKK